MLNYVSKFKNVDQDKLMALGFGGGIQSAFYLTMKSDKIKALVNLEGGVFSHDQKQKKSPDYNPSMMRTPMLHIVTVRTTTRGRHQATRSINKHHHIQSIHSAPGFASSRLFNLWKSSQQRTQDAWCSRRHRGPNLFECS
ncbi:MAG: hypothetical protein WDO15_03530 [Bacteroidota bacterium]